MKLRDEWKWIVPIVAVCVIVFANSLTGEFVYDDMRQILRNSLIQDNSLMGKALTSDVWAFKGDGSVAASNYWRPTFTAWHILNYRLFGQNPFGWHVTNLLLHSGVCVMVYALLRRWAISAMVAFAITVIFAVHPVHVESVSWISGSPDLLFSLAFLASLWFAQTYAETGKTNSLVITIFLYALALGAKEIGIVCLPIYYFVITGTETKPKKAVDAKTATLTLGAVAAGYFLLRWAVLGAVSRPPDDAVGLGSAVTSIPEMFAFYLRQIFFPYWTAANYPLEPVTQIGAMNFLVPLLISAAALAAVFYLAKASPKGLLAAALFLLPLLTAMNANAFISEQIVHDRYLYLPLLGLLMLVVPVAAKYLGEQNVVIVAVILSVFAAVQTVRYNTAWANDLSLWTWTTAVDDSSFSSMQYGSALAEAGRDADSITAFSAAIAKKPVPRGYIGRGRGYLKAKQYQKAEADLLKAIQFPPEKVEGYALYQAYEALGIVYSEQRNYDAAIKNFAEARTKLPMYSAALSTNLAVVQYQAGQKDSALRELEGARTQARKELLPESKAVFFRLGMLYGEMGRKDEARTALREFIDLTTAAKDKDTVQERSQANTLLQNLK